MTTERSSSTSPRGPRARTLVGMRIQMGVASLLGVMIALGATTAKAGAITYTYTGNDFTIVSGAFTTSDFVQGNFTVSAPLGDNLVLATIFPISINFSNGNSTAASAPAGIEISTNASGAITGWLIELFTSEGVVDTELTSITIQDEGTASSPTGQGYNISDPGTWQVSTATTPEPTTFVLLTGGLLAMALMAHKRLAPDARPN